MRIESYISLGKYKGTVILSNRYFLGEIRGVGVAGTVYIAEDLTMPGSAPVAIKLLHPKSIRREIELQRLKREILLARDLHHANIIKVHELGKDDANTEQPLYYLVMEYVPGGTLKQYLENNGALPFEIGFQLITQLFDALAYAHARGVLHRDLKPENLLMEGNTTLKIADFGAARSLYTDSELTGVDEVLGSPAYMAPELFQGHVQDEQTDIYAAGLIACEILTGVRTFKDGNLYLLSRERMAGKLPKLKNIPSWFETAIHTCLAVDRNSRFQTASAALTDFRTLRVPASPTKMAAIRVLLVSGVLLFLISIVGLFGREEGPLFPFMLQGLFSLEDATQLEFPRLEKLFGVHKNAYNDYLFRALNMNMYTLIRQLIDRKASLIDLDNANRDFLLEAIGRNDPEILTVVLTALKPSPGAKYLILSPEIYKALEVVPFEMLATFYDSGKIDINQPYDLAGTTLLLSAMISRDEPRIKYLLDRGANHLTKVEEQETSILCLLLGMGDISIAQSLLQTSKISFFAFPHAGNACLSAAAKSAPQLIPRLLDLGAGTPEWMTTDISSYQLVDENPATLARVINHPRFDIEAKEKIYGNSALHAAVYWKRINIVRALVNAGANILQARRLDGLSPLAVALHANSDDVVCDLLHAPYRDFTQVSHFDALPYCELNKIHKERAFEVLAEEIEAEKSNGIDLCPGNAISNHSDVYTGAPPDIAAP